MKKVLLLSIFAIATFVAANAQKPIITFADKTHDFGIASEEDNKITHVFTFKNTGDAPLVLNRVQASCGCTTPEWSREPIAPGGAGSITVTYSTAGRPGPFTKTISVSSNADAQTLTIKGSVTPRGETVEKAFPIQVGDIRLKTTSLGFGDIPMGESKKEMFPIANTSDKDIVIKFVNLPKAVTVSTDTLKAKQKTNIPITINTKLLNKFGNFKTTVSYTIDNSKTVQTFDLTGNVYEQFTQAQIDNSPVSNIPTTITFGIVKAGKKKAGTINVGNDGKSVLFVRDGKCDAAYVTVAPLKKGIAVGGKAKLKIEIDATKLTPGNYEKIITLTLNEPRKVQTNIKVLFTVE